MRLIARVAVSVIVVAVAACAAASSTGPTGQQPFGVVDQDASSPVAACPPEMAHVDTFCVDKWEASLVLRGPNGVDVPFSPYQAVGDREVKAVSRAGVVPQGYVSQLDATAACERAGKRICRESEWVRACKGPAKTTFPYGDVRQAGTCNGESTVSPLAFMPPGQQFPDMTNMNNPKLNQLPNTLTKTGEKSGCTNAFGVFDMVGNLHEWVAPDPIWGASFLGGYYRDTEQNGAGCNYKTTAHRDWYHDYSTGFRCCKDARSD